jgi:hypothetical protein
LSGCCPFGEIRGIRVLSSGNPAFDRVLVETSAQYLVGVDVATEDRSDRAQVIQVKVKPREATVRHRMSVVIPVAVK